MKQEELAITGHAIERASTRGSRREFLPATGRIIHLSFPETTANTRIDTGIESGDEITRGTTR